MLLVHRSHLEQQECKTRVSATVTGQLERMPLTGVTGQGQITWGLDSGARPDNLHF